MKENKRVEIKQKPGEYLTKEKPVNKLPKTMARQVWLKSKERVLSTREDNLGGSYSSAQEMEEQGIRQGETMLEDGVILALEKTGNAARKNLTSECELKQDRPQNTVYDEAHTPNGRRTPYAEDFLPSPETGCT